MALSYPVGTIGHEAARAEARRVLAGLRDGMVPLLAEARRDPEQGW